MKLTWFGHSAFLIEIGAHSLLLDPFITGNPRAEGVIRAENLAPHEILLTHAHGDHFGDTVSIARRTGARVIADFEVTEYLRREHSHENVFAMNTGGSWRFDWGKLTMTHALHTSSFPDGAHGGAPHGFILEAEGKTLYAMGDTSPFSEMAWLGQDFRIDAALIPVGDCFTMGPVTSVRAASLVRAALYIPIHYDTFPPIEIDVSHWQQIMGDAGHKTRVLKPGESFRLD